jgi:hypothetical protein
MVDIDLCSSESSETLNNSLTVLSPDSNGCAVREKTHNAEVLSDDEDAANEQTCMTSQQLAEGFAVKADISSCSSNSSAQTELSTSAISTGDATETDENGFVEIALGPRNSFERASQNSSNDSGIDDRSAVLPTVGAKPKKKGISDFLARYMCVSL